VSDGEILRHDGCWPSSPVVGRRGAQTRRRIFAETLKLFETHGFHRTSAESIAKAVGTSRATLYQYFGSKEQIFLAPGRVRRGHDAGRSPARPARTDA
jgi:hypothetical protein